MEKFGPHDVITSGEIYGTLVVVALAAVAFIWMAYRTRQHGAPPATTAHKVVTTPPKRP